MQIEPMGREFSYCSLRLARSGWAAHTRASQRFLQQLVSRDHIGVNRGSGSRRWCSEVQVHPGFGN